MTTTSMKVVEANDRAMLIPPFPPGPVIVGGKAARVTDDQGKVYIDLEGGPGVSSVGHCHPRVVSAIQQQATKLIHSPCRYINHLGISLAARISAMVGGGLNRAFFTNSGAEANDGAVKLTMKHATRSGKQGYGIIALEHSFHGRSALPLALTGAAGKKKGFGTYGTFPGIVHVSAPYCYRCPYKLEPKSCAEACAGAVEDALLTKVPGEAAIMIAEPILAVGGVITASKGYWKKVTDICRRNKITLIFDEVFTGFARTGKPFGHDHYEVKPQVMTFAKTIGGGVPMGGFIATEDVGAAFEKDDHFTTYGINNQIGLAAAHAVLDIIEDEHLCAAAAKKGELMLNGLRALAEKHQCVGDVRGAGLMIGVELVLDKEKKTPAPQLAQKLQQEMRSRNILVSITGAYGCVMRVTPPLVISEAEIGEVLDKFDAALKVVGR